MDPYQNDDALDEIKHFTIPSAGYTIPIFIAKYGIKTGNCWVRVVTSLKRIFVVIISLHICVGVTGFLPS
jgi:hypothetical protein